MEGRAIGVGTRPIKPIKVCLLIGFKVAVVSSYKTAGDFETPLEEELEDTHFYTVVIYCLSFYLIVGFSLF